MAILLACGPSTASPTSSTPIAMDRPASDERRLHAIDARVLVRTSEQGKWKLVLGLSTDPDADLSNYGWTGRFIVDGKEVADSEFKLKLVKGRRGEAEITANALPSETVRLFPPGYTH